MSAPTIVLIIFCLSIAIQILRSEYKDRRWELSETYIQDLIDNPPRNYGWLLDRDALKTGDGRFHTSE